MRTRVLPVAVKELREIRRDPLLLWIVFGVPLVLLFLFGYALSLDIERVRMAVLDQDRSHESAALAEAFANTGDFVLSAYPTSERGATGLLNSGAASVVLVIPPGFGRDVAEGRGATVQTLVDGGTPSRAVVVRNTVDAVTASFIVRRLQERGELPDFGVRAKPRVWYNESLRSSTFVVPGLFAVILMAFPPLLTALAIVREKESGSVQQIYVSPLRPWEFIAGKMVPYVMIAFGQLALVIALGSWWFHVPFRGSPLVLLAGSVVYVFCTVGIGLLVSTLTRSQVVAILLATIITVMPSFLFSGFLYPISSMPPSARFRTYILPVRYFTEVSRDSFLRGTGIAELWPQLATLAAYTALVFAAASLLFRKKVA